ncbi:echinoderm microtubule-associated protein-like 3 isoform X1 [Solea senegalensis]|uniref:Echinoderm microtubule-associated protein-like 3 isoform X1 n=2 Tax=Solea senegalensis TaxID=28829 RepID=A0AAV6QUG1_SOLSE|nr:echinoderm microtubule-associated protein-like 3 isoform X1 [Solea senegalensis]KAG7495720.1 echinoderm microtubule-associated protein-like 3 isoform X1 [Solea senegalensis]
MNSSTNSLDDVSADSSAEFPDRASMMEVRLQAQEDEITLLKSSLADALRRIRLHDQLLPLLKQQLIAVNPGAARVLNQVCCPDGCTSSRKLSSSSAIDGIHHSSTSSQLSGSIVTNTNGHIGSPASTKPRPVSVDRSTQTESVLQGGDAGQDKVPLHCRVQSLNLEDALPPGHPVEATRAKLHRVPGMEEEDEEEDDEVGGEQEKELSWTSSVEEPIQPTTIRGLQREESHDGNCSPEEVVGSSSASLRASDQNLNSRCGPLSPIQEGLKTPLVRRNSEKLGNPERQRKRLDKKAASSANLLTRSPSLENRAKDLIANAGSPGSRRGTYSQGQSIKMFIRGRPITMYVPSNIQNYEDLKMEPPTERLELDWVYGYRGRDCRANMYFLPTGEAIYFIACVIVLYHINNRTQRHYRKHTDCVRCLTLHPDKVRVASGQTAGVDKDGKPLQPCVHIWDSTSLVTLQQIGLGCFQRGVGSVAFSFADSGVFLCVIDDSNEHMLSVWDCNKGVKHAEVKSTNEAVFAVEFNPGDSSNIITCGKSHVYFWTLNAGLFTKKQGIFGKYKKPKFIQCFVFSLTGDVLTGDSEGNILTWGKSAADIKTLGKGAKETFQIMRQTRAHEGSVFTLCTLQGGGLLSGGGKDRKIIRWSADLAPERECEIPEKFGAVRTIADVDGEEFLVGTTRNAILRGTFSGAFVAIVQGHVDEMWGLATHPSHNIFITCGHDRQVCLWNTEEHKLDWCISLEEYGLCADFCPNGSVVSVGLSTGKWMVLDLLTRDVVSESTDGNEQLSVMRYSPDGSFLAVGSHDNFIYIYTVTDSGRRYTRFGKCNGHSSFITHLDWSKDGKYIMSNSGDYEILYWDIAGGCKLLRNRFESKDREWASYTCVLGFHVMGVWLEGSDGTDINALCRSHSERMVAVADDFCKVHLFQYPCPKPKAPSHKYDGHGSHVTNVCFTHCDSHLLSMGGKDMCILQWKVVGGGASNGRERLTSASSTSTSSPEPTVG